MLVLYGVHPRLGDQTQYFTLNEKACALAIAEAWLRKGWKPVLLQKSL